MSGTSNTITTTGNNHRRFVAGGGFVNTEFTETEGQQFSTKPVSNYG